MNVGVKVDMQKTVNIFKLKKKPLSLGLSDKLNNKFTTH